jgi:hypothetical protein
MRAVALAIAFLLGSMALLVGPSPTVRAIDFGAIGNVNKLIDVLSTPQLAPGESGPFTFQFNVTYAQPIFNVRLNASIYEYATIDGTIPVDITWHYPYPVLNPGGGREVNWSWPQVGASSVANLSFTVVTVADSNLMPHGSVFNQAAYFVRFWLEFDGNVSGTMTHFRFASRGFFSNALWNEATSANATTPCNPPSCRGNLNLTKLNVNGILPDSSFSVQDPIPRWPFYLLIGVAVFFVGLAFLFWVEENPEAYPRVAAWWARQRGRFARLRPVRRRRPIGP